MTEQELKIYKEWGLHLIPLKDGTKVPDSKKFWVKQKGNGKLIPEWCWKKNPETKEFIDWSDEELLKAERLGINHEACNLIDVDCDALEGSQFMSEFPDTLTIGKKVDGSTYIRKKIYFYDGLTEHKSFGKDTEHGSVIENLAHTQSFCFGKDRITLNNVKPTTLSNDQYKRLKESVREVYALTMLAKYYPKKDTFRDKFSMALTGTLLRQTNWNDNKIKNFIERLCNAVGDNAVNKRTEKIGRFRENLDKEEKKVFGVKKLTELCGVDKKIGLDFIDAIKPEQEKPEKEKTPCEYPLINASMDITYPPTQFIMEPIFTERSTNQFYGEPESGKTLVGTAIGIGMSSGHDFIGFKSVKKVPVLYVEGELPGTEFRSRIDTIVNGYAEKGLNFNSSWFYYLTRDDLEMHGFKYGFDPIAVSRNLSDKDAIDYGKAGRELIEKLVKRVEKETGVKPFFFLDNVTALADIDENRAQDWTPLIQWTTHMKSKGYSNCFMHHANKSTGTSSGSGAKERLLDTSIKFEKLMPDQRFEMPGYKNLQCRVKFTKSRNFGGGQWDKPFILTMDEHGKWSKYPNLVKDDFIIIELFKAGISVKEMEADPRLKIKEKTIYKHIYKLKKMEVIK